MPAPLPRRRFLALAAAAAVLTLSPLARAADAPPPQPVGVVSNISVVSDKVEDVSSIEAWRAAFIKPGISDKEKAVAVWRSVVMFRHQTVPPRDYLGGDPSPLDPIRTFNVYGYNMCNGASAAIIQLARTAGLEARGWAISHHSVPEVKIDGKWALLDASLVNYFEKPDGSIAGVEEICKAVADFYAKNPTLRNDDAKLRDAHRAKGWTGSRHGPELVSGSKFFDAGGWWPAGTHGWYATLQEYGTPDKNYVYEYGAALGYRVNVQLRRGERLTRNWSNKGLHVDRAEFKDHPVLAAQPGKDDMKYSPAYRDLAPGRVGNGTHSYDLPLADGSYRAGMLRAENLADAKPDGPNAPLVRVADAAKPAVLEFRMPSSYVYLGGRLAIEGRAGQTGSVAVAFSDNNGLDWKPLAVYAGGPVSAEIDLSPKVLRRYDYRLRITMAGAGTGLTSVRVTNDVQHSQRALPALDKGENKIAFRAGPPEGTVTVEGSATRAHGKRQLLYTDFHPTAVGIPTDADLIHPTGATGELTFPIAAPGDIARVRVGAHYRARGDKDAWDVAASFDDGKTWRPIGRLVGPVIGYSTTLALADVPAGSRKVLVRFAGTQRNTLVLLDARVDVDYREPAGGFAPVKVTYVWDEAGRERRDEHVARAAVEAYAITCAAKPTMKSVTVERAD